MKFKIGQLVLIVQEDEFYNLTGEVITFDVGDHPYLVRINSRRTRWFEEWELEELDQPTLWEGLYEQTEATGNRT